MSGPSRQLVRRLVLLAGHATCQQDHRAAIVMDQDGNGLAGGTNGLPDGAACGESCANLKTCRDVAEHAEAAAIRNGLNLGFALKGADIVHAKLADKNTTSLATSRPPAEKACLTCAVAMVANGIAGIWLFVEPGEWRRFGIDEYWRCATKVAGVP